MPAHLTTVADAVVDLLNASTFSDPHKAVYAVREYRPKENLEEIQGKLLCKVVQRSMAAEAVTRAPAKTRDLVIEIGIQRTTNFADNADGDALLLLVQEIEELFLGKALGTSRCITSEIEPPYSQEHVHEMQLFTSVIRLTFRSVTA